MIPATFSPPARNREDHLKMDEGPDLIRIRWPLITGEICTPPYDYYPDRTTLASANPLLKFHGHCGYSFGQFHEFFLVEQIERECPLRFGHIHVSVGEVTPLGIFLFDGEYDQNYMGDWECHSSIRLSGCNANDAEAVLLNAIARFTDLLRQEIRLLSTRLNEQFFEELERRERETDDFVEQQVPLLTLDLEPMRLFYHGLHHTDNTSAFLQFYRILEFYSFLSLETDVGLLRRDGRISDREFAAQCAALIGRDERGPILRLVNQIANTGITQQASSLVGSNSTQVLGSKLYDFRNSVVHAKYGHSSSMTVESIFQEESTAQKWRGIAQLLAVEAMNAFGRKT